MTRRPKAVRRLAPTREQLESQRFIRPFAHRLADKALWRFTRDGVARGVALGLFAGFILPLGQIVLAALLAVPLRANLIVAAAATLVTNPVTFPAIYYAAYSLGVRLLGNAATGAGDSLAASAAGVTLPTFAGLLLFAVVASALGYVAVRLGWRAIVAWRWRRRRTVRPRAE